jgi:DNA-binding IclR family transcriptional regulator
MSSKADFTEDEWKAMQKGATGAGLLVAVSDRDFTDTFKEAGALVRHLRDAREKNDNQLIRELAETRATGFGLTDSPPEIESETLAALSVASSALEAKAPDDASAYRQFVLDVAESVAASASGVEPAETTAIDKIRGALGPARP